MSLRHAIRRVGVACAAIAVASVAAGAGSNPDDDHGSGACEPGWTPTFGAQSGIGGYIDAMTVFDDGSGPALHVAGYFSTAGSALASSIARWDGETWWPLSSELPPQSSVSAMAVFDDGSGSGPALYVGGNFTTAGGVEVNRIARWDGNAWSDLDGGMNGSVWALAVFDDGSGNGAALYAGGTFSTAGGQPASRIARWDGNQWLPLGSGVGVGGVSCLAVFDDGNGPALYAGGGFLMAGGNFAKRIAKWNGTTWSNLGSGLDGGDTPVISALTGDPGGPGRAPALYAAGTFLSAGGLPVNRIARWNGQSWSGLSGGTNGPVRALQVVVNGDGDSAELIAAGLFTTAGGATASSVASWNGQSWSAVGGGISGLVRALALFDAGAGDGTQLHAGGSFLTADGLAARRVAKWNGQSWAPLGRGLEGLVHTSAMFDDGRDGIPALYVGGEFVGAGDVILNNVAKWDGEGWTPLGAGTDAPVRTMAVFDDGLGGGPALYIGGQFLSVDGVAAKGIARWDGTTWSPVGDGLSGGAFPIVHSLVALDARADDGPLLYAGGTFLLAGNALVNHVAKWDGTTWSPLGTGTNGTVNALAVHDDGSGHGPALYAAGGFFLAGDASALRIARWDGQLWSPLGSGLGGGGAVALTVWDDGSGGGPALFVGGNFTAAGGVPASRVARWDGQTWAALGDGSDNGLDSAVHALSVFDDGSGDSSSLHVGGAFSTAGGAPADRVARWDGSSWSSLDSGINGAVLTITPVDDDQRGARVLYVAGNFTTSVTGDAPIVAWRVCAAASPCRWDLTGDGAIDSADLALLLAIWGACADCWQCPFDATGDCTVGGVELGLLLAAWGACAAR